MLISISVNNADCSELIQPAEFPPATGYQIALANPSNETDVCAIFTFSTAPLMFTNSTRSTLSLKNSKSSQWDRHSLLLPLALAVLRLAPSAGAQEVLPLLRVLLATRARLPKRK